MDERAPLLQFQGGSVSTELGDHHTQFCRLVGAKPVNHPHDEEHRPHPQSLYARAVKRRSGQSCTYMFTATLVNTLLLTQVVLGAVLTGLGASNSSRILITVFGALNTVIAGVLTFLKSRGQPMRARMFRDDLSRVVDEIENSAVMWYGISASAHGYDAIDTDDEVTVRSEVARLTRLYDKAVKTNTMNNPDMYSAGSADSYNAGLRKNPGVLAKQAPPGPNIMTSVVPPDFSAGAVVPPALAADPDASSPSKAPEPSKTKEEGDGGGDRAASPTDTQKPADEGASDKKDATSPSPAEEAPKPEAEDKSKEASAPAAPAPAAISATALNPDESPASAARVPTKEDSQSSNKTLVDKDKSVSA